MSIHTLSRIVVVAGLLGGSAVQMSFADTSVDTSTFSETTNGGGTSKDDLFVYTFEGEVDAPVTNDSYTYISIVSDSYVTNAIAAEYINLDSSTLYNAFDVAAIDAYNSFITHSGGTITLLTQTGGTTTNSAIITTIDLDEGTVVNNEGGSIATLTAIEDGIINNNAGASITTLHIGDADHVGNHEDENPTGATVSNAGTVNVLDMYNGVVTNTGKIADVEIHEGDLTNAAGGEITLMNMYDGGFKNEGTVTTLVQDAGDTQNYEGGKIADYTFNDGNLDNAGTITDLTQNAGSVENLSTGVITSLTMNDGGFENSGLIGYEGASLDSDEEAVLNMNNGSFTNKDGGDISGLIVLDGGAFLNEEGASIDRIIVHQESVEGENISIFTNYASVGMDTVSGSAGDYTIDGTIDDAQVVIAGGQSDNFGEIAIVNVTEGVMNNKDGASIYDLYIGGTHSIGADADVEDLDDVGSVVHNAVGGWINNVEISGGELINGYTGDVAEGATYSDAVIESVTITGGEIDNYADGLINNLTIDQDPAEGYLAHVNNLGTITEAALIDGELYNTGGDALIGELTVTGGTLNNQSGASITTLIATDASTAEMSNEAGAYIRNVTLGDATLDNYGILGIMDDIEGSVTLNDGAVLNNQNTGVIYEAAVNTGATLNNEGTIGQFTCEHGHNWTGTLSIDGGTVNNTNSGYIYMVDMSTGVLNNVGLGTENTGHDIVSVETTAGSINNSAGGTIYSVNLSGESASLLNTDTYSIIDSLSVTAGSATNIAGATIGSASVSGGTLYNGDIESASSDGSTLTSVTVTADGTFTNNAIATTVNAGDWSRDDQSSSYVLNMASGTITTLSVLYGADVDNYGVITTVSTLFGEGSLLTNYANATIGEVVVGMNAGLINKEGAVVGTATVQDGASLENDGTVGSLTLDASWSTATATNTGSITTVVVKAVGDLTNSGTIGTLSMDATLYNEDGAVSTEEWQYSKVSNSGTITSTASVGAYSTLTNTGNIGGETTISGASAIVNNSADGTMADVTIESNGTLNNSGDVAGVSLTGSVSADWVASYATMNNNAGASATSVTLNAYSQVVNSGADGDLDAATIVTVTVNSSSTFTNYGTVTGTTYVGGYEGVVNNYASLNVAYVGTESAETWGGTLNNSGAITSASVSGGSSLLSNTGDGSIETATVGGDGTLNNAGSITSASVGDGGSLLANLADGSIETATVNWDGTLTNKGAIDSLTVNQNGTASNYAGDGGDVEALVLAGGVYNHYGVSTDGEETSVVDSLDSLELNSGTFNLMTGTLILTDADVDTGDWETAENSTTNSTMSVASGATLILAAAEEEGTGTPALDLLVNDGTVAAAADLTLNSNVQGSGNLEVAGTLTIKGVESENVEDQAGTAANITAESIQMAAGSLSLTEMLKLTGTVTDHTATALSAADLEMMLSSTLYVSSSFQADNVAIIADGETSGSMNGEVIITAENLLVGDTGMNFELSEASLLQFELTTDEYVRLLDLTNVYDGADMTDFSLTIVDSSGTILDVLASGETYTLNNQIYMFEVGTTDTGEISYVDIKLTDAIPEPSTTALSLLALAGLAARRRRKAKA